MDEVTVNDYIMYDWLIIYNTLTFIKNFFSIIICYVVFNITYGIFSLKQ